jgi:hypothetical protein
MTSVASGSGTAPTETFVEAVHQLHEAAYLRAVEGPGLHVIAPLLRGRFALRPHTVDLAVDTVARDTVQLLLTHGWTPTELRDFAHRRIDPVAMSHLVDTLAAATQITVAAPWSAELPSLGAEQWWSVGRPHLSQWAVRHGYKRVEAIRAAVEVLALVCHVPRTDAPIPGAPEPLQLEPGTLVHDPRMAAKIDALLARAADLSFPEEARSCAAKAQALMVRYATVPDIPASGPITAIATAALEQLVTEGPSVVAKTLFAGMRKGVSLLTDPRKLAGATAGEVLHLFQRLAAAIVPTVPALPERPSPKAIAN